MDISFVEKTLIAQTKKNRKTVSRDELKLWGACSTDKELYELVDVLVQRNAIKPMKGKGRTNGNLLYPVVDRFHILIEDTFSDIDKDIKALHPRLLESGYLIKHKDKYREHKARLDQVSRYLFKVSAGCDDELVHPISKKCRSYLIFGEEKVLDDEPAVSALLKKIGFDENALGYYDTPPYAYVTYEHNKCASPVYLITENRDIFFDIRRLMSEDNRTRFFDTVIDGVILGNGGDITKKNALTEYARYLRLDNVRFLYCGDIDRAGFNLFKSLKRMNPELRIDLFVPLYEKMLDLSKSLEHIEVSGDGRRVMDTHEDIIAMFDDAEHRVLLTRYISDNNRIPQEILHYFILRCCSGREADI